jgi:GNAT superfamily N-acetyltransferase
MVTLRLVPNEPKYYETIRVLRTHPENQEGFVEQVEVTPEQQISYMEKYEKNYWICLHNNDPVGFVGEIDGDIRFAVNPKLKGRGIGTFMVNELLKHTTDVYAKVLHENVSSQKVFQKCGFKEFKNDEKFIYFQL